MASTAITFDVLARDNASRTFDRIAHSTSTLESRFSRTVSAAKRLVGVFAGFQIGHSVLESADALELSRSRLEQITKNIGGNFEELQGQVDAADARLAKFGFTSADTEGALASLETATRNPTRAFKDLGLAADIARGRNISLEESVRILQRVETGHVTMLSRLGIQTKDAAGNTLTMAEALRMLAQTYGGAASRYAGSFAGKQAAVTAELKNAAAQIGIALLPAAVDFARALQHDVLPPLISSAQWLDRNRKIIEPLVKVVIGLWTAWKLYTFWTKAAAAANLLLGRSSVRAAEEAGGAAAAGGAVGAAGRGGFGFLAAGAAASLAPAAAVGAMSDLKTPDFRESLKNYTAYVNGLTKSQSGVDRLKTLYASLGQSVAKSTGANQAQFLALRAATATALRHAGVTVQDTSAVKKNAASQTQMSGAVNRATTSVKKQVAALLTSRQRSLDLSGAQDSLREAIHNMAQTVGQQSSRALKGNSDAALANRDALRGAVSAALSYIQTLKAQHVGAQRVAAVTQALSSAILQNASATYGNRAAVMALLQQLHFLPRQIRAALGDTEAIGEQVMNDLAKGIQIGGFNAQQSAAIAGAAVQKQLRLGMGLDAGAGVGGSFVPTQTTKKIKDSTNKLLNSISTGYTPVAIDTGSSVGKSVGDGIANGISSGVQKVIDHVKAMVQKVDDQFKALKQKARDLSRSIADTMRSSADLSNMSQTDTFGAAMAPSVAGIKQFLEDQLKQDRQFRRNLKLARSHGLSAALYKQLAQAGPAQAGGTVAALAHASRAQIRSISRTNADISQIAGGTGRTVSRDLYGAAIKEARHDQREANRLLAKILHKLHGDAITVKDAHRLEKAFERALHRLEVTTDTSKQDSKNGTRVLAH